MAGLFPRAANLDQFWLNLREGVDASSEVPPDRWVVPPESVYDPTPGMPDRTYCLRGYFLDHIPQHPDLVGFDPLYHLTAHVAAAAWADARTESIKRQRVGVVLGNIALPTEYASGLARHILGKTVAERLLGHTPAESDGPNPRNRYVAGLPAVLVARLLGLGGGAVALDAACASTLYALKFAADELAAGRADAMLAGGVCRADCMYTQMGFAQLRALATTGRCAPFDAAGSGLLVGEGAGCFVLKRLDDALAAGDHIYAILAGAGLSNDRTGNLLAPASEGQLRAMRAAYAQAGWQPGDVDVIECHATGTPVGDATEFASLIQLWQGQAGEPGRCVIGSVKANVGHLLTGAGAPGLIKLLLGMRQGVIPPTPNFNTPAAQVPLAGSPFRVLKRAEPWPTHADRPRRAAISGFGFGGINAHLLLEEWCQPTPTRTQASVSAPPPQADHPPIAIVGLEARVGPWSSLRAVQERILGGGEPVQTKPKRNWWGARETDWFQLSPLGQHTFRGYYIDELPVSIEEFRIPPKELEETLPQQLLMLQVATAALVDAGLPRQPQTGRTRGVFVGLGLDLNTTNFHFRWSLANDAPRWAQRDAADPTVRQWVAAVQDAVSPPLTANRVMGNLGSIAASRIARLLGCAGPSLAVSSEETSGIEALALAVRALQRGELDEAIVGGVDLAGDLRAVLAGHADGLFSDHFPPAEGACALVLMRLDDAQQQNRRIYAVLGNLATASTGTPDQLYPDSDAQSLALTRADLRTDTLDLSQVTRPLGYIGAAQSLMQVVGAAVALYQRMLLDAGGLRYWLHDNEQGPRRATVRTAGAAGNAWVIELLEAPTPGLALELRQPAGARVEALFAFGAESREALLVQLDELDARLAANAAAAAATSHGVIERLARTHAANHPLRGVVRAALVARSIPELREQLACLRQHVQQSPTQCLPDALGPTASRAVRDRIFYTPAPLAGELAFVYPGSGNCYPGMTRELACQWPEVLHRQQAENQTLFGQYRPDVIWSESLAGLDGRTAIFAQVSVGTLTTDLLRSLGVQPDAVVGYSLGESAGFFAMRAWPERDLMYRRICESTLFTRDLAPPYESARLAWDLPEGSEINWFSVVLRAEPTRVRAALPNWPRAYLLIVNSPHECVVGGERSAVEGLIREVGGQIMPLSADVTIAHCEALAPVAERYHQFHTLTTVPPPGVRFYSGALGRAYSLDVKSTADAILGHASATLDFARLIEQTYVDGVRLYIEHAPGGSCTRLIDAILADRPHRARAICVARQSETSELLRLLGWLIAEGRNVDLQALYGQPTLCVGHCEPALPTPRTLVLPVGTPPLRIPSAPPARAVVPALSVSPAPPAPPALPIPPSPLPPAPSLALPAPSLSSAVLSMSQAQSRVNGQVPPQPMPPTVTLSAPSVPVVELAGSNGTQLAASSGTLTALDVAATQTVAVALQVLAATRAATAEAHAAYLRYANNLAAVAARQLLFQMELLNGSGAATGIANGTDIATAIGTTNGTGTSTGVGPVTSLGTANPHDTPAATAAAQQQTSTPTPTTTARVTPAHRSGVLLDRAMCLEFAVGSIAKVLGPEFAEVDTFPTRVRLPDEPLMLVDRILALEGEPRSLGSGRIVTEHDVTADRWYLDGGIMPVCVAVESGQADLFLSGYLGIDFRTRGLAVYRLLDAVVTFHRHLPRPGETIHYDIRIRQFFRQGQTYLFRFEFDATINGQPLLTMRDGCAGFFTAEELASGKGIVQTALDRQAQPRSRPADYPDLAPLGGVESYSAEQIDCLRWGDLAGCFGSAFAGLALRQPQRLPSELLRLVDRVTHLDPNGGRFGLGLIRAELDIHPDDWFLTCHFVDDQVMPGTLMYECCLHTLRILLMRMGWVGEHGQTHCEPVVGQPGRLRCRGQVTAATRTVTYEVTLKEVGFAPEPFVLADALMFADGKPVVEIVGMSLRLSGLDRDTLARLWSDRHAAANKLSAEPATAVAAMAVPARVPLFDRDRITAFAIGNPSEAFGEPYRIFDRERVIARLPGPPYQFLDRIMHIAGCQPFVMAAGGEVLAEYDVPATEWYFAADRSGRMPFAVLLEIALQPCGWLAAYVGSALTSDIDLSFRNLGGQSVQHAPVGPDIGTLSVRVAMTRVSRSGGMIIQNYDFAITQGDRPIYTGDTYFGFFSKAALAQQVGIREAKPYQPTQTELARAEQSAYPDDPCLPTGMLTLIDRVDVLVPDGGPAGLGYIAGSKRVVGDEWFFAAHFYQDPVIPGSLGLESFLQLLKLLGLRRWGRPRMWQCPALGQRHTWVYRGQVLPTDDTVRVMAWVTRVDDAKHTFWADGFLTVDGRIIYQMRDFSLHWH